MEISFRHWLENLDDPNAIQDPDEVAQHWYDNLPVEPPQRNEQAIRGFVNAMSEDWYCGVLTADHLQGHKFTEVMYDDKAISNNLLMISHPNLGMARGIISNEEEPEFKFKMGGINAGNLYITTPPFVYEQTDRDLLASIIYHELGHAIDFLAPKRYDIPSGRFRYNAEAYAKNINEARRYADQLKWLLRKVGNVQQVISMLEGDRTITHTDLNTPPPMLSPFRMSPALLPVAKAFLTRFHGNLTESWLKHLAGPLLTATAMAGGNLFPPQPKQPTAIVANEQERSAQEAAQLVKHIMGLMLFRGFVA